MDKPKLKEVDVSERGAEIDGKPQVLNRRLFVQLLVFRARNVSARDALASLGRAIERRDFPAVIYEDANDPDGIGLVTWSEDPAHFVTNVRFAVADVGRDHLEFRPEFTMLGRTYSIGYEQDLEFWLIRRTPETLLDERWNWAVWYPLKRTGAFSRLDPQEQGRILREHGAIGRAYGEHDLAHDVRLACHGIDANDNDFVIGLIGADLHPLSHVVQSMRKTRQTSEFIDHMGPFFVGHAAWRRG